MLKLAAIFWLLSLPLLAAPNLRDIVDKQLAASPRRIIIPPGRYRVQPERGVCLAFKNLTNVDIVAKGVEMVCTETSRALGFEACQNVHFSGMTIDYDPLPFTEGRITAMAPDKSWFEFEQAGGYPEFNSTHTLEIFDPLTGELARETASWQTNFVKLARHRFRVNKYNGYRYNPQWDFEKVGDIVVADDYSAHGNGDHAIVASHCAKLTLEDVTLYASPLFGFLELDCDGNTYRHCVINRRSPAQDPVLRGLPRYRSLDADAFHSIGAARGPAILGCTAKYQADDCVNIHGRYHLVMASHGDEARVLVARELTLRPGAIAEFIPYSGPRPANAKVLKVEPDSPMTDAERKFITLMPFDENLRKAHLGTAARFYKITFDRAVSLPMGSGVCASDRVGNGCEVRDCDFGYNRSRGIIIKASHAKVIGNKLTHDWMQAVLVSPEFFWWLEAACPQHVVVADNIIVGCRQTAIEVTARGGNGQALPAGALDDITIRHNIVKESPWPNLHVTSTSELRVKKNQWTSAVPIFSPRLSVPWDWKGATPSAVLLEK